LRHPPPGHFVGAWLGPPGDDAGLHLYAQRNAQLCAEIAF
jgi:hypothetical protein